MSVSRHSEHAVAPFLLARRSPRYFQQALIEEHVLLSLFEAARWAPSASNSQPWRFIYARNGTPHWPRLLGLLNEKNQVWAANSSALIVLLSKTRQRKADSDTPTPLRTHSLDTGAAWLSLALQAEYAGWHAHAIGGLDRERARTELEVPDDYQVEIAIAIGQKAEPASLSAEELEREVPTLRAPLEALIAEGSFAPQWRE
ncbi:MAG: nitroreductase [Gammaproteobacteria bacterium HGW-Gammaproteobacteria-11]|nr:MAG: nitroreductase [Gammaproteobacteria bacterium HGW-Gammaproteobacteria-11]